MSNQIEALAGSGSEILSAVLDQTHDCIKLLDADGLILFVNQHGAAAMEMTSPAELVGQSWVERWPSDVRPKVSRALVDASEGQPARFIASRPKSNGEPAWWDVTVSPVRKATGAVTHFLTIARDMTTEVVERERARMIGQEMRHRLQNAMTVAAGLVTIAARGMPEVKAFADDIIARFARLTQIETVILSSSDNKKLKHVIPQLATVYGDGIVADVDDLKDSRLSDQAMQALALSFGELATNSIKYGALRDGNLVRIEGTQRGATLELVWREATDMVQRRIGAQGLLLCQRLVRAAGGSFVQVVIPGEMTAIIVLPALE